MADILVIDDEENLRISIQVALRRAGHTCRLAGSGRDGLTEANRKLPDLALVDINLPDTDGLTVLGEFQAEGLEVPVIVITAYGTVASAVAALQQGAVDYIQKPLAMEELVLAVDRCLENRKIRDQLDAYRQTQQRESGSIQVIARCTPMRDVLALAEKIADVPLESGGELVTVLLSGETGTGKEAVARYIHHHSRSADRPFVHVNCTAIPQDLFESELFGHEAGAFTGAKRAKKGLFEMADEGTLFLDEIGDMPLGMQAKLLVAIEGGRFRRLGGTAERVANVRVMAATNSNLEAKVEQGHFRADLYYRLKVFCVDLPPLRERGDDLFLLADHFMQHYARKFHKGPVSLAKETRALMRTYQWRGNVRELANVLQRAVLLTQNGAIDAPSLGIDSRSAPGAMTAPQFDFAGGACTLAAMERQLICAALQHADRNISEAARLLGLTRGGLRHRIEKLGLNDE